MVIIELSNKEIEDLLNGEELDKTFFAYDGCLIIRRLPILEDDGYCKDCNETLDQYGYCPSCSETEQIDLAIAQSERY